LLDQQCQPQAYQRQDQQADDQIGPVARRGSQQVADRILQLVGRLSGDRAARAAGYVVEGDIEESSLCS
jgi:hypothetical protein